MTQSLEQIAEQMAVALEFYEAKTQNPSMGDIILNSVKIRNEGGQIAHEALTAYREWKERQ